MPLESAYEETEAGESDSEEQRKRKRKGRLSLTNSKRAKGSSRPQMPPGDTAAGAAAYEYGREYEIEKIIARRQRGEQHHYLIRWKGYTAAHDTWEPADNLTLHAREWFEQELDAGLRDKRTGRLKAAAARQQSRSSRPTQQRQPSSDSHDAAGDAATRSVPAVDTEGSGQAAADEPRSAAGDAEEEVDIEQPQHPGGERDETTHEHDEQSAELATGGVAVSPPPVAAVGLSAGRQRRSIRPPRPYSPSQYDWTARRINKLTATTEKRAKKDAELPDDDSRSFGPSGYGADDGLMDSDAADTVGANSRDKSNAASNGSKRTAFRQRAQLHVSVRRAQGSDVIDLATPPQADSATLQPSSEQKEEQQDAAHTHSHPAASGDQAVGASGSHSAPVEVGDTTVSVAQPLAELTYEVEAVVDRRFNSQSIAPGCCVTQAFGDTGGEVTDAAVRKISGGRTLLPESEWDEGCSGSDTQHSTHCEERAVLGTHSPHSSLPLPPLRCGCCPQDLSTASSGWATSHTALTHSSRHKQPSGVECGMAHITDRARYTAHSGVAVSHDSLIVRGVGMFARTVR